VTPVSFPHPWLPCPMPPRLVPFWTPSATSPTTSAKQTFCCPFSPHHLPASFSKLNTPHTHQNPSSGERDSLPRLSVVLTSPSPPGWTHSHSHTQGGGRHCHAGPHKDGTRERRGSEVCCGDKGGGAVSHRMGLAHLYTSRTRRR
jgi:hypothetical protein